MPQDLPLRFSPSSGMNRQTFCVTFRVQSASRMANWSWRYVVKNPWDGTDGLELPTILLTKKSRPKGRSPENMVWNLVRTYLHFRILFDSHWTISKFVQFWGPTGSRCLRPSWRRRTKDGGRRGGRWAVRWRSCWLMSSSCGTWSISYRGFMGGSPSCWGYNWRSHVGWWL